MYFDFLGYSGWVFTERIGDTDVAHLVIQGILDELTILGSQVFILFHSRYLLKPETQQEKNSIKEAVESVEKGRRLFHPYHSRATAATTVETGRFAVLLLLFRVNSGRCFSK